MRPTHTPAGRWFGRRRPARCDRLHFRQPRAAMTEVRRRRRPAQPPPPTLRPASTLSLRRFSLPPPTVRPVVSPPWCQHRPTPPRSDTTRGGTQPVLGRARGREPAVTRLSCLELQAMQLWSWHRVALPPPPPSCRPEI